MSESRLYDSCLILSNSRERNFEAVRADITGK